MNKAKQLLFSTLIAARQGVYGALGFVDTKLVKQYNNAFVLSYHSVADDTWRFSVDEKVVKQQITYLKNNFDIITLKTLREYIDGKREITKPSVVLTFDDGYKDILKLKDFFAKQNITPAIFLLANTKEPNWKELGTHREFLNKTDIKSLAKAGWEIGCHSATHANLATLTDKELYTEIGGAKQLLEKELGITIPYFAYPRGKYNQKVLAAIKKAKFEMAFTMDDGFITAKSDLHTLPRVGVDRTHTFSEFKNAFTPSVVRLRKVIKNSPVGRYL